MNEVEKLGCFIGLELLVNISESKKEVSNWFTSFYFNLFCTTRII